MSRQSRRLPPPLAQAARDIADPLRMCATASVFAPTAHATDAHGRLCRLPAGPLPPRSLMPFADRTGRSRRRRMVASRDASGRSVLLLGRSLMVAGAGAAPLGAVTEFATGLNVQNWLANVAGSDGFRRENLVRRQGHHAPIGMINATTGATTEYSIAANGGTPQPAERNRGRSGRQSLVRRSGRHEGDRGHRPDRPRDQRVQRGLNPAACRSRSRLARIGTCGSRTRATGAIGLIDPTTDAISEFSTA